MMRPPLTSLPPSQREPIGAELIPLKPERDKNIVEYEDDELTRKGNELKKEIKKKKVNNMDFEDKAKIKRTDLELLHSVSPDSTLRDVVRGFLDIDNDGDVDLTDWKYIFKFTFKWISIVVSVIWALITSDIFPKFDINGDSLIKLFTIIGGIIGSTAWQKYKGKRESEVFLAKILKYKDMNLKFVDLFNKLSLSKETAEIQQIIQDFMIKVKDELYRKEVEDKIEPIEPDKPNPVQKVKKLIQDME